MNRLVALVLVLASAASADRIVNRYGEVTKVKSIAIKDGVCKVDAKSIPLKDIYLAERDDGTFLYAPSMEHRLRGYAYLVNVELRREYMRLALSASQVGDMRLAQRALRLAESAGLSGKEVTRIKVAFLKRKPSLKSSERLKKRAAELGARHGRLVAERAALEFENGKLGRQLLFEALRLSSRDELA